MQTHRQIRFPQLQFQTILHILNGLNYMIYLKPRFFIPRRIFPISAAPMPPNTARIQLYFAAYRG